MSDLVGNERCRQAMAAVVEENRLGVFFVHGPWGLGKKAFLSSLAARSQNLVTVESSVDGIREAKSVLSMLPIEDDVHDVVVLDCDKMSVPAQDACLKLLEEPPYPSRIWLHASDFGAVQPALLSRKRSEFRWSPLPREEMEAFAGTFEGEVDPFILELAAGRPGCYSLMRRDPRFKPFHQSLVQALRGERDLLIEPLPVLLSELEKDSPFRELVYLTICHAAKSVLPRGIPMLEFASKVLSHTALNVELHFFTALAALG